MLFTFNPRHCLFLLGLMLGADVAFGGNSGQFSYQLRIRFFHWILFERCMQIASGTQGSLVVRELGCETTREIYEPPE